MIRHNLSPGLALAFLLIVNLPNSFAVDLRVGVISQSVNKWPMWVAQDRGFFKAQGVDVELIITGEATVQLERLGNGDLDISHQAADHIIRAVERGENFVVVRDARVLGDQCALGGCIHIR